jgi:hypothetical protein
MGLPKGIRAAASGRLGCGLAWKESRGRAASISTVAANNGPGRPQEDAQVQPLRRRPCVLQIEANHVIKTDPAAPVDLPQSRNPGLRLQHSPPVPEVVSLKFIGKRGRGPTSDMSPRSTFQNCGSSSRTLCVVIGTKEGRVLMASPSRSQYGRDHRYRRRRRSGMTLQQ